MHHSVAQICQYWHTQELKCIKPAACVKDADCSTLKVRSNQLKSKAAAQLCQFIIGQISSTNFPENCPPMLPQSLTCCWVLSAQRSVGGFTISEAALLSSYSCMLRRAHISLCMCSLFLLQICPGDHCA